MFSKLSSQLIDRICEQLQNPKHVKKIHFEIIKPILKFINIQIAPFYFLTVLLLLINIIINSVILYKI